MQLKDRGVQVETGSTLGTIGHFGIEDDNMHIVFDILRSKMYANPIRAIIQEVSSNARDAHREVGKNDLPIEIKLPTHTDSMFYIRDFGPGITPERMANVFLNYASSTKRDSNNQTGGFGLGAKTPFAYASQFTIVSITPDESDKLIKRTYVAVIDESKKGRIDLIDECNASPDEKQGTTIVLACKSGDENTFKTWLFNTCKYWKVKPDVRGVSDFEWKEYKTRFEGNGWGILDREKNRWGGVDNEFSKPMALVDGIPYELSQSDIFPGGSMDDNIASLFNFPLRLYFETGEIELSSTRESINHTAATVNRLKVRIHAVIKELQAQMKKKVSACKNLWEAQQTWYEFKTMQDAILREVEWKGIVVDSESVNVTRKYSGLTMKRFERQANAAPRMKTEHGWSFHGKKAMLCVDDTGCKQPSKLRITTLLNKHTDVDTIYVITITDWKTGDDPKASGFNSAELEYKKLAKAQHFKHMNVTKLSKVEKTKTPRQPSTGSNTPVTVKTFRQGWGYGYNSMWQNTKDGDVSLSDKGKVYVILYNRDAWMPGKFDLKERTGTGIYGDNLSNAAKHVAASGKVLHGVPFRLASKLGKGWIPLDKWVDKEIAKLAGDKAMADLTDEIPYLEHSADRVMPNIAEHLNCKAFVKLLDDADNILMQYLHLSQRTKKIKGKRDDIIELQSILGSDGEDNTVDSSKSKLVALRDAVKDRYQLFAQLDSWQIRNIDREELAFYVNAKDKAAKTAKSKSK